MTFISKVWKHLIKMSLIDILRKKFFCAGQLVGNHEHLALLLVFLYQCNILRIYFKNMHNFYSVVEDAVTIIKNVLMVSSLRLLIDGVIVPFLFWGFVFIFSSYLWYFVVKEGLFC